MSTAVFAQPKGTGFPVSRTPMWSTTVQQNISGKEVRVALQSSPRWKYELTINLLRSSAAYLSTEYQYVVGFFNARQGMYDTFLYQDADDNSVTGQGIGTGDGTTKVFQLVRAFGGFVEPVLAPNLIPNVYLNGVKQLSGYGFSVWGSPNPGLLTFTTAPASGVLVTVDMSYYWPCRMSDDSLATSMIMSQFYEIKKFAFISVKN